MLKTALFCGFLFVTLMVPFNPFTLALAAGEPVVISRGDADPYGVNLFKSPAGYEVSIDGYRGKWSHISAIDFSGLHWNHFVTIFINQDAHVYRNNFREYLIAEQFDENEEEYKPNYKRYGRGTTFVKEHYISENGRPGAPTFLSIMIKREKGYDPGFGDWQYIQSDINGNLLFDGNSKNESVKIACLECHSNMAERDYIFALNYKDTVSLP